MVGTINQSESCTEVCGGAWRGAQRCAEGWWGQLTNQNLVQRCTEVCGGVFVHGYHWLPIATIDLVGDNREFEV